MSDLDRLVAALEAVGVHVPEVQRDLRERPGSLTLDFPNGERFALDASGFCGTCEDAVTASLIARKVL